MIATALVAGYREEQKRQLLGEASQRPFLIDSLLEGRAIDRWSLCEVASHLRLPANGPFVVIAAEALPWVSRRCQRSNRSCAAETCIRHGGSSLICRSGSCMSSLSGILTRFSVWCRRLATNRVGVSARFDDLRDTPQALHFAKVMLRGRPHEASPVAVFDGSILATAAVSAPDVMVKLDW